MLTDWKNKRVAVLGIGVEGLSSTRFLTQKGARVTLLDERETLDPEAKKAVSELGIGVHLGKDSLDNLGQYDIVVRSPGFYRLRKELLEYTEKGGLVTSQIQLFMDYCPCSVIGVTGTKGKGTTSSLIYEMLLKSGKDAYLGGNIGKPPLEFLDTLNDQSIVVLELSSFQLQDLTKSPHIAVVLMITPEHLNYHADMSEYVDAKRNILRFQSSKDFAILNRDYLPTNESDIYTDAKVFFVTRERETVGDGAFIRDGILWLIGGGQEKKIIDIKDIKLPGKHNLENVSAAVMAASLSGVGRKAMVAVLTSFTGLEHRLELIGEVNGVKYYDDSFSTTPETAIAAIEAFTEPEVLILGGSSKNADFIELGKAIAKAQNIKAIIGIGVEWEKIKKSIEQSATGKAKILMIEGAKDMKTIVQAASRIATPGDLVILSPACASFDMFKNYKDRGEQFKKEINRL